MAEKNENQDLEVSRQGGRVSKIDTIFNWIEHVVHRTTHLLGETEFLIFRLAFLLFLIYKMAEYANYLLHSWH